MWYDEYCDVFIPSIWLVDVTSLLKGLRGLSHDLDIVTDNTEEMELRRLYVERYNHYFVSVVKSKINIGNVDGEQLCLVCFSSFHTPYTHWHSQQANHSHSQSATRTA